VATEPPKPEPVVPVTKSVFADHLVCLDCGKHYSMLKRHLRTNHKLTVAQYRQRWGLPYNYPVVAPKHAKDSIGVGEEDWIGSEGYRGAKEGRKEDGCTSEVIGLDIQTV
jgi:predicted transcriptional regulator